ncbi:hypothetical protein FHT86_000978 [Rhizobium sp. BK313]|nr:hypothetical protein [Rhizobium sp. BK313]
MQQQLSRKRAPRGAGHIKDLVAAVSLLLKIAFNVIFWKVMHSKRASDVAFDRS